MMPRLTILRPGRRSTQGFTIMEIVISIIIISILALILIPAVSRRTRQARITSASEEMSRIADAQQRAFNDTNYYYRLYVLDDVIGGDNEPNDARDPIDADRTYLEVDGIRDIPISEVHTSPTNIFIDIFTEDFAPNFSALFTRLATNEIQFGWNGPYLTWSRDANHNDWPDDPWGNDYLLFTRAGVLIAEQGPVLSPAPAIMGGQFQITGTRGQEANIFDRPTLLSLGPDGLPGNGAANPSGDGEYGEIGSDDIIFKF